MPFINPPKLTGAGASPLPPIRRTGQWLKISNQWQYNAKPQEPKETDKSKPFVICHYMLSW